MYNKQKHENFIYVKVLKIISNKGNWGVYDCEYSLTENMENLDKINIFGKNAIIHIGDKLKVFGDFEVNSHGMQFHFTCVEKTKMTLEEDAYRRLVNFKGVGDKIAKRILSNFGLTWENVLKSDFQTFKTVCKLTPREAEDIRQAYVKDEVYNELYKFFNERNVSHSVIDKIYQTYGENAINRVKENPYKLFYDLKILPFSDCDTIAKNLGVKEKNTIYMEALILNVLEEAANEGHCFLPFTELKDAVLSYFMDGVLSEGSFGTAFSGMINSGEYILGKNNITNGQKRDMAVYLKRFYVAERYIGTKVPTINNSWKDISDSKYRNAIYTDKQLNGFITKLENDLKVTYSEQQKEALKAIARHNIVIVTGGPGVGKTFVVKGILAMIKVLFPWAKVAICAPTGRAAKRAEESTGEEATTIHQKLEYGVIEGKLKMGKNEHNPLDVDILIIDEFSMVDVILFKELLKAIKPTTKIIIVGDIDQLPSVKAGNVLADLIDSTVIKTVKLDKIYRQSEESAIISNAYKINKSIMPVFNNSDFTFEEIKDSKEVREKIANDFISLVKKKGIEKVQILTPMKKGNCGTRELNNLIQRKYNPLNGRDEIHFTRRELNRLGEEIPIEIIFRVGDKVIQTDNDYEKSCMNGDTGIVKDIILSGVEQTIVVQFDDGKEVEFKGRQEIQELNLAYAITIHKAQGSEYDDVLIPVVMEQKNMLTKNLIYTGVTRAKKNVRMYGQMAALKIGVDNTSTTKRNSLLKEVLMPY